MPVSVEPPSTISAILHNPVRALLAAELRYFLMREFEVVLQLTLLRLPFFSTAFIPSLAAAIIGRGVLVLDVTGVDIG